jgi:hypothetical protein
MCRCSSHLGTLAMKLSTSVPVVMVGISLRPVARCFREVETTRP